MKKLFTSFFQPNDDNGAHEQTCEQEPRPPRREASLYPRCHGRNGLPCRLSGEPTVCPPVQPDAQRRAERCRLCPIVRVFPAGQPSVSAGSDFSLKRKFFYVPFGYLAYFRLVVWRIFVWLFGVLALIYLDRHNLLMNNQTQRRLIPSYSVYSSFIPPASTI